MSGVKSYFSHDSNARNDEKILAVRMRHGAEGYAVYFMILERLREETDYMSIKDYNVLAFDFRVSPEMVRSVVEDFALFEFNENDQKFYSKNFLERMSIKDSIKEKRSLAGKKGMSKRWSDNNDTEEDNKTITNVIEPDNKKSKVKESKVNKSIDIGILQREFYNSLKPYVNDFDKQTLREFFDYWSEPNRSKTKIRWQLEKTWDTKKRLTRWASNGFNKHKKDEEPEKITYKPKS